MVRSSRSLWLIIFLVFGLYFVNSGFSFIEMPQFIVDIDQWITLLGGLLIIFGGFSYYKSSRYRTY